ncbi:unnamed protein product, partial [Cylicocyclus nassatus]
MYAVETRGLVLPRLSLRLRRSSQPSTSRSTHLLSSTLHLTVYGCTLQPFDKHRPLDHIKPASLLLFR